MAFSSTFPARNGQGQCLGFVLGMAKPGWSETAQASVMAKLQEVGVTTAQQLDDALDHNLNERLKIRGHKTFGANTVRDLKVAVTSFLRKPNCHSGEQRVISQVEEPVPKRNKWEGIPDIRSLLQELDSNHDSDQDGDYLMDYFAPQEGHEFREEELPVDSPLSRHAKRAPDREDWEDQSPALRSDATPLDPEDDSTLRAAVARGIPVSRLMTTQNLQSLVIGLEGLETADLAVLRAECSRFHLAHCRLTPREELQRLASQAMIWKELSVMALRQECQERSVPLPAARPSQMGPEMRSALIKSLQDSTWEAIGIPVRRYCSFEEAMHTALEFQKYEQDCSSKKLSNWAMANKFPVDLLNVLPLETAVEWMKLCSIWKRLPLDELQMEVKVRGMSLGETPMLGMNLDREALVEQLKCDLRFKYCEAAGLCPKAIGMEAAEGVLKDVASLSKMGRSKLQARATDLGIALPREVEGMEEASMQVARDFMTEAIMWCNMPLERVLAKYRRCPGGFPEIYSIVNTGNPPSQLFIKGSWDDAQIESMTREASCFTHTIKMDTEQARFQLALAADQRLTLYPSTKDAGPTVPHCILGPNDRGLGYQWLIDNSSIGVESLGPGMICIITVSFEEDVPKVTWQGFAAQQLVRSCPKKRPKLPKNLGDKTATALERAGQAVKELLQHEARLVELEGEGLPIRRIDDFSLFNRIYEDFTSYESMSKAELHKEYEHTNLPPERCMERPELLKLFKRMRIWKELSVKDLVEECSGLERWNDEVVLGEIEDNSPEEQAGLLVGLLLMQDRMLAWESRGFEALKIRSIKTVTSLVRACESLQDKKHSRLRDLWHAESLPWEEEMPREEIIRILKIIMVWSALPVQELQKLCKERGAPDKDVEDQGGMTKEELQESLVKQLKVSLFRKTYEARGLQIDRVGLLKAANQAAEFERFEDLTIEELRTCYEGDGQFLPADITRDTLLTFLHELTLWESLSTAELCKECEAYGVEMHGFSVKMSTGQAEGKLRDELVNRLILRQHVINKRGKLSIADLDAGAAWTKEVWARMRQMRDPFIAEHMCHIERKPVPSAENLPVEIQSWQPLEAALYVLTGRKFNPIKDGRGHDNGWRGEADDDRPFISVVCPTSESRQHFHSLLYECYRTQDYKNKELVIVDSGSKPSRLLQDASERDSTVVYKFFYVDDSREEKKSGKVAWSLGMKRNVGCYLARGVAIAHFDDDDLYASGYLSWMVRALQRGGGGQKLENKAMAKLREWHLVDLPRSSFHYLDVVRSPSVPEAERRDWIYGWGFSYVFTRSAWEMQPFPDVEFKEDAGFIEGLMAHDVPVTLVELPRRQPRPGGRASMEVGSLPDCLVAHSLHPGSTSGGEFNGTRRSGQEMNMPRELFPLMRIVEEIMLAMHSPDKPSRAPRLITRPCVAPASTTGSGAFISMTTRSSVQPRGPPFELHFEERQLVQAFNRMKR